MATLTKFEQTPIVMSFSYNDPCGGSGVPADIETLASMGCHCAPIITAITIRDTCNIKAYAPSPPTLVIEQARAVLEDMPVAAIKIGLLGSIDNITAIHTLLLDYPHIPIIFKPVLSAVGAISEIDNEMTAAIFNLLCPITTMLIPNINEAQALAPSADNLDACAQSLMEQGCKNILITGTHDATTEVKNYFYSSRQHVKNFVWERLPTEFLGSSCTLTACIAGLIAHEFSPLAAVEKAQQYTWECLEQGVRIGMGSPIPKRLYWAEEGMR